MMVKNFTVGFGIINNANPMTKDAQPILVIMSLKFNSQTLCHKILSKPIMIAKNEERIRNFSSLRSSKICLIRFGFRLNIKKNIRRHHPQNFAKNIELSMILVFFM
jgi:hypothetical protein